MIEDIIKKLEEHPNCRERKNRGKFMALWLKQKYPFELEEHSLDRIADIIKDAISMDRAIRKVQQDNPSLRGEDYEDKEILEQEAQLKLGYTPGYPQDVKKLDDLSSNT